MKLHLQAGNALLVTGCGDGWIRVNGDEIRENIVLTPEVIQRGFAPAGAVRLDEQDFAALLVLEPEIVLLGTGARQSFLHPRVTRVLTDAQVGIEVMDTAAACRTYNILAGEGRRVVAGLIVTS